MERTPLKSRNGCRKCKERRKKCDEIGPVCGGCARLGFVCRWDTPNQSSTHVAKGPRKSVVLLLNNSTTRKPTTKTQVLTNRRRSEAAPWNDLVHAFDSPSILRTNAVPTDGTAECKHILQYMSERGTDLMRFPYAYRPTTSDVNVFKLGFRIIHQSPMHLHVRALLCLGAEHLSDSNPAYQSVALRNYSTVMSNLRQRLTCQSKDPLPEWPCAVASILSFYELVAFHSPESRLAHLVGYHRLVEARLEAKLPWAPFKVLVEQYIRSFVLGSFFHYDLLVGERPITYVDDLLAFLRKGPRPLGNEITGVPEELTAVVYRLSVLNVNDIGQYPWDVELLATASRLANWRPAAHTLLPSATGLLLVAKLYHLTCICLLQVIANRTVSLSDQTIFECVQESCTLLRAYPSQFPIFSVMMWPLTMLSVFAVDHQQQWELKQPILALIKTARIKGYRSILDFLSIVQDTGLGAGVLQRPDLLSMVHM